MLRLALLFAACFLLTPPIAHAYKPVGQKCVRNNQCSSNNCLLTHHRESGTSNHLKLCAPAGRKCGWANSQGSKRPGQNVDIKSTHKDIPNVYGHGTRANWAICRSNGWDWRLKNGRRCGGNDDCKSNNCASARRRESANSHQVFNMDGWPKFCAASGRECGRERKSGNQMGQKTNKNGIWYTCTENRGWVRTSSIKENGQTCTNNNSCISGNCNKTFDGQLRCAKKHRCSMPSGDGKRINRTVTVMSSQYQCTAGSTWKGKNNAGCRHGIQCMPGLTCRNNFCKP